ncbi:acetylcholine receptor subunit alpha-like [Dendroctonus ponderosae]|uniref:Nicotinic acetylcholine receptor alpha 3 subunit n=1 Tax=Dendroctonus ponderosae TaxID=77166 RepID=A0AAR5P0M6_DENPD|nr:acetylcholine receptor subunit alpha-like [Dendroctonus ponderosae]
MVSVSLFLIWVLLIGCHANPDAKRLYDDLLSNYNKLVRPVANVSDALSVKIKLKLSQLIDVNLKNQIMTTNVWVEQSWYDYKLQWNPMDYGNVDMLHVPSDDIWRPDIVLYNNADGNFEVTLATKATLNFTGLVEWRPPAIYKSSCEIDVEYFPFDEQTCVMKFGSWTYDGFQVDLRHTDETKGSTIVEVGIDLKQFYKSVEWDILEVPAIRTEKFYRCCKEPYLDITFNITMRRKTLFYTVNLIIPCMGISFLTILVFYLPSDSGEKVSLSISILLSLIIFFLLLAEIIPPTSLVVPLLGKFVLFTMILDTFSICVTVIVLNVHFRCPQTHVMSPWVRRVFIHILPRLLMMRRPHYILDRRSFNMFNPQMALLQTCNGLRAAKLQYDSGIIEQEAQEMRSNTSLCERLASREAESAGLLACRVHGTTSPIIRMSCEGEFQLYEDPWMNDLAWHQCPEFHKALNGVRFIAGHIKRENDSIRVKEDWKYVAMVLDRLFLWIFTLAVLVGTAGIILQAPTLYDDRQPIDPNMYEIMSRSVKPYVAVTL